MFVFNGFFLKLVLLRIIVYLCLNDKEIDNYVLWVW